MVLLPIADIGDKPSTSTPQKRPSPNSNDQLTSKRLNSSLPVPSPLNETNQSAIEPDPDAIENESDEMDVLAAIAPHESRSIEKNTASADTMCINQQLSAQDFMQQFELAWLPASNACDTSGTGTATDKSTITKSTQENCTKFNDDTVKLYQKPFKICVISDFLENASFTQQLVDEMCSMEWQRKQMDLYEFFQTNDLSQLIGNDAATKPALKQFYSMLNTKMLPWMRKITGLSLTRVSASCSMYNYGDYLLVHDDLLGIAAIITTI